jgi:hypothetical protein
MKRIGWTSFIVFSIVLAVVVPLTVNSVFAQTLDTSLGQNNNAVRIVDANNNTIATIDPKTDQIVNVSNSTGNATSGEILIPQKIINNQTLTK